MAQENITQRKVKILIHKPVLPPRKGEYIVDCYTKIKINNKTYKLEESNEENDTLETTVKIDFDNNLFNLNCTFIGEMAYSRPDLRTENDFFTPQVTEEKEFNISKKINFSNNELKIYFDECCNLDKEI